MKQARSLGAPVARAPLGDKAGMQLAFCIFRYPPHGGPSQDFARIAAECVRRGHRVRAYALRWEAPPPAGVEAITAPARGMTGSARHRRFAAWVSEHLATRPADVVIGMNKTPGFDAYFAGDGCFEEEARRQRGWHYRLLPRHRHFAAYERAVFAAASRRVRILTLAAPQEEAFKRWHGIPDGRFIALPPVRGADARNEDEAACRAKLKREFALEADALALLFVGSGFAAKGFDRLLRALAALPEATARRTQLLIVGADRARRCKRLAARLGVARQAHFLGGRDDVPELLRGADALALPACDEATGGVIVEALAAGLPLLVSSACEYAPFVSAADAGIVSAAPFDQARFNAELARLLTDARRAAWRENGRRYADRFTVGARERIAVDCIERCGAENQAPTVAFCLHRVTPDDGASLDLVKIAAACIDAGFSARVYTMSWRPPAGAPTALEVAVAPVAAMTRYKRHERFEHWVRASLSRRFAHCVVGFNKMAGLDLYLVTEPCIERHADQMRRRWYRSTPAYRHGAAAERAAFAGAVQVLAQNARQVQEYRGYYDVDMRFIGPFVNAPRVANAAQRAVFRGQRGIADDALVVLNVGGAGLDRALLAVAGLPSELVARVWVIVANGGRALRSMANGLGLGRRTRFEKCAGDAVAACYAAADLLLHTPHVDLAARPVLAAIGAGLPVLTMADAGYAEHVVRADAGVALDAPFDLTACKRALADALSDADRRRRWRENGLRYGAQTQFGDLQQVVALISKQARRRGHAPPAA